MIRLPAQLTPSELLWCEECPAFIIDLLCHSRALRKEGQLPQASRCARDAMKADQKPGTKVIQAMALIHLADARREMGRLGPALDDCQTAYRIFQSQSSRYQRHNEATAAYALGLVDQLLGSDMDALKWYQASNSMFEIVKDDWTSVNALARVTDCNRVQCWMETLGQYLTSERARTDENIDTRLWVPIVLSRDEQPRFAMAELEVEKYILGRAVMVDGVSFHARSVEGKAKRSLSLDTGVEYYALGIPAEARDALSADEGDYALVARGQAANKEGPGVVVTAGGAEFGEFKRDGSGTINFVRPNATVIGGDQIEGDLQVGYIAALLRPTPEK